MQESVWLILPTYNERANLEGVIRAALAELEDAVPEGFRILIVDDDSPDGTGTLADVLAAELEPVQVLHRAVKTGLGRAYRAGFAVALEAGATMVIEMDADFSHDPRYLPMLLAEAENADLVLGSRYVPGGGVRDWGVLRRLISRGGGFYARTILGVDVQDLTGGFKCIRREVLEAIDLDTVRADGYVFQIEVTYRALMAGFKVREVPIVFVDRTAGKSKMSTRIALEAIWVVPAIRRGGPVSLPRKATGAGQNRRPRTPTSQP